MPQTAVPRPTSRWSAATSALVLALVLVTAPPAAGAVGYDYGDAPADLDAATGEPASALLTGPRLGTGVSADRVDPDTGASSKASETAEGDDDDALPPLTPVPVGRLTTLRMDVAVSGVEVPARLCGWVDLDLDRAFRPDERSCAAVPIGAETAVLRWDTRVADAGHSFVRLRIATVAAQAEQPDGRSRSGEVEDHPVTFLDAPDPPRPLLSLQTEAAPAVLTRAGQLVRYAYRARNRGGLALHDVTVSDLRVPAGSLECSPATGATLAPGAALTCTATVTATQEDLDFGGLETAAEARAEAPGGNPDDPSDDVLAVGWVSVGVRARPALAVAVRTTAAARRPGAGDAVRVAVSVTNSGNVSVTGLRLDRLRPALQDLSCGRLPRAGLAPGADLTCTGRFVVGEPTAARGRLEVRVGVRGERPYGSADRREDDVVATATRVIALTRPAPVPAPVAPRTATPVPVRQVPDATPTTAPTPAAAARDGLADSGGPAAGPTAAALLALLAGAAALAGARRRGRR